MGLGAIILIEAPIGAATQAESASSHSRLSKAHPANVPADVNAPQPVFGPLALLELFGQSLLDRTIERFADFPVEQTSILIQKDILREDWIEGKGSRSLPSFRNSRGNVAFEAASEVWIELAITLNRYAACGIDCAFIASLNLYQEANLADLLAFHSERRTAMTRACDAEGPLDLWVVNCGAMTFDSIWQSPSSDIASLPGTCLVKEYVKRIVSPRDFRQLAADALLARCRMCPSGREIRPGIWTEPDAQIYRGARIVAPAYLGHGATIRENALLTRCSNIERSSYIDCGTAIEDSSVLPNTYIGISLDVRHSLVSANRLVNLERNAVIEVSDPSLFRANISHGNDTTEKIAGSHALNRTHSRQGQQREDQQGRECFAKGIPAINTTEFES